MAEKARRGGARIGMDVTGEADVAGIAVAGRDLERQNGKGTEWTGEEWNG